MGSVQALGYIGLAVRDLEEWNRYATDILGMQTEWAEVDDERTLFLRMDERHHRIAVSAGNDELSYVGWQVAGPDDLASLARDLDAAGVAYKFDDALAATRGVSGLLTCTDPAGCVLEFHYGALAPKLPFVSPTGARFVTKDPAGNDLGLGHVVIVCDNVDETLAFYREVLGFLISDYIKPIPDLLLTFLHINPRHHSLAISPNMGGVGTAINHFMVEVDDVDTVGRSLDKVHAQKIQKLATLGRHTNDKMLSFYMRSPSGFGVEYGTGGALIDDTTWAVVTYDAAAYWGHEFDPS